MCTKRTCADINNFKKMSKEIMKQNLTVNRKAILQSTELHSILSLISDFVELLI